ncbi:MAG: NAD(P)/FAD-dependent oxidoreductase [Oscillospiraceae bacterium]|nr:NAD(P)/FAD-dependent oxidoreductase [Oscillospiraceae bacterium]
MRYDAIIIGGGPAGISAALTLSNMGRKSAIIATDYKDSGLYKAKRINNYPGAKAISGEELLTLMYDQLSGADGVTLIRGLATNAVKNKKGFMVTVGADVYESSVLIMAIGIGGMELLPGEAEMIGHGVSYCAVCDGGLYRGKKVAVIKLRSDCDEDIAILKRFKCEIIEINNLEENLIRRGDISCVFIFRKSLAINTFMPGLKLSNGINTNIDGVFAAGDCIGNPLQIAKAVGEGQLAAYRANEQLTANNNNYL